MVCILSDDYYVTVRKNYFVKCEILSKMYGKSPVLTIRVHFTKITQEEAPVRPKLRLESMGQN